MKIPTQIDLIWPTLVALRALGGSGTIGEIVDKILEIQQYSQDIQNAPHTRGNYTKLEYNAAWARTRLKNAGAVENSSRGVWSLTEIGKNIAFDEIPYLDIRARETYSVYDVSKKVITKQYSEDDEYVENTAELWHEKLLNILQLLEPSSFEKFCQRLLRESGFSQVVVTGKPGDGGIDGMGVLKVNLLSFHVIFQCKRYKGAVGSSAVRDFRGAMAGRTDKGLIMTTGSFTSDARKEATRDGTSVVDLIDGRELCELVKNLNMGVDVRMVEEITVDEEWFKKL